MNLILHSRFLPVAVGVILAASDRSTAADQPAVFYDEFSTSTLNAAAPPPPSATGTDYAILSSKNASGSSITRGRLDLTIGATSSGLAEGQAFFVAHPVSLTHAGDCLRTEVRFTAMGLNLSNSATINFGLFNSGGIRPVPGGTMNNGQLGTSSGTYASGYAAGWVGYVGRINVNSGGGNSELFTRPAQSDTTNESQDLLFHDGVTGGFDTPTADIFSSLPWGATLVDGRQYTYTFKLTRTPNGFLAVNEELYFGSNTLGAMLFTLSGTTDAGTTLTTHFDALAFGYRADSDVTVHMTLNSLQVTTNPPVAPVADLVITNLTLLAGRATLSGSGGKDEETYSVLAASTLSQPATNWPAIATNAFNAYGNFLVTNLTFDAAPQKFFRLLTAAGQTGPAPIGFATGATGGAGGPIRTVSTASGFASAVQSSGPRIVLVDGLIEFDKGLGNINIWSDKTILGVGTNAWISGQLEISGERNVILRNLSISNNAPAAGLDGIRIVNGSHHVWVDHCTFLNCSDGELDITVGSGQVTVSWCKFHYTRDNGHNFANLIAASDTDVGTYQVTFHHNWWSSLCRQRMPASRYGTVHLFNNYFFAPGNSYCSNARTNAQFLSENNYYRSVNNPIYKESNGRIKTAGNVYLGCSGQIDPGRDSLDAVLSPPPYAYTLDAAADVPSIVTNGAGAGLGPFAP